MSEILNPEQSQAVHFGEGPLLVLAGAGSGKTRVITFRIAHLIESGIDPEQILAVTFTNKAAEEMRSRIHALTNKRVLATTFHSLGARILRGSIHQLGYQNTFAIYDEDDSEKLLKSCLDQLGFSGVDKGFVKETKTSMSEAKNNLSEINDHVLAQVYHLYNQKLKECNAVDFDDLLYLTVQLLQNHPDIRTYYQNRWRYVLIDEYQDTNIAQYTIAKILSEKNKNIFVVGDPDQSIYSWRGARFQNILNFERDFPGAVVITLDQNYRSTNTILEAANALIEHNSNRFEKKLWSELGVGSKIGLYIGYSERQEADFVASRINQHLHYDCSLDSIAIFYRTNAQSRPFEDALLSRRIPYTIIGGVSFYERKEVKDILAYLRMLISNSDLISFLRTMNAPKRGIGLTSLDKLVNAASSHQIPILTFCDEHLDTVKLGAKQRESLKNYIRMIHHLRLATPQMSIHEVIQEIITQTGYLAFLQQDPDTAQERKENIDELMGKAAEWEEEQENPSIQLFLEELALRSTIIKENPDAPSIKMMTLHNSKGLEFPIVFLAGLEEDLLPHINSKMDPAAIEEERRLCYVGITRAKKTLYLTASTYRYTWGTERLMAPSRFLRELPEDLILRL
ncbi:MAG TPA: UvrD-helicase domain-containing protein [Chlamydiales bacterium]|nr:UvrD-helicase domain-containing protein [Chlamydiales bacterium]